MVADPDRHERPADDAALTRNASYDPGLVLPEDDDPGVTP